MKGLGGDKGQALVELALVIGILTLVLLSIVEFGRLGHAYLVVHHASREGARVAALGYEDQVIRQRVQQAAGSLHGGLLDVTIDPAQRSRGDSVSIEVAYPLQLITPVPWGLLPNPFTVRGKTIMRVE